MRLWPVSRDSGLSPPRGIQTRQTNRGRPGGTLPPGLPNLDQLWYRILNPQGFYVQDSVFSCRNPFSRKAPSKSAGFLGEARSLAQKCRTPHKNVAQKLNYCAKPPRAWSAYPYSIATFELINFFVELASLPLVMWETRVTSATNTAA